MAEHFTPLNLTSIQFAALVAINDSPGLDATRLAALIDYDRPTMTGVIDRLEAKGLVMREVEAWWIDADFPDDKLSIIERLKAVAQGMA
ncbi:MAG TPA: MarR family transcriptional regulator [Terricaulis sp.]|nr:MarR family transcriptional regulator [Terricaulis sp.]